MQTKLEAVNSCLRGIGVSPVSSLEEPNLDAGMASEVVDSVKIDILSTGWWFNTELNWKLKPPPSGEIRAPNNALDVVSVGSSYYKAVVMRGTRLYDVQNHTFDLSPLIDKDGYVVCTFIVDLPFEELPPQAQRAVTYVARRLFAQDMEVDPARWKFQMNDEQIALNLLKRTDVKQRKVNYQHNAAIQSLMARVGGMNSGSYTYKDSISNSRIIGNK